LSLVANQMIDAKQFVTHCFALNDIDAAYDTFARAGDTGALKVALKR
jgi:alcohol dehydrogenase